MERNVRNW